MEKFSPSEGISKSLIEISDTGKLPGKPLVSVIVLAYNHGPYLAEAIENIISQQVTFSFELIIGEDCSSDNTREIAMDYQNKYPHLIRILYSESNVGMNRNLLRLLACSHGEFIAICEGDDYWLHPEKLSMQIAAFEARKELMLLFTDRVVLENGASSVSKYFHRDYVMDDVLEGFIPPTQTMMWRNNSELQALVAAYLNNRSGDRLIVYFCTQKGVIGHLDVVTAAYRMSGSGVWSSTASSVRRRLKYKNLVDFHQMLKINATNSLMNCAKQLLLDTFFDIKRARGKFISNICDVFYFSQIVGIENTIRLVTRKVVKV